MNASAERNPSIRKLLRWGWVYFLYSTGLLARARRRIAASCGIVVLTFHRVLGHAEFERTDSPSGMTVRSATYERLLQHVAANFDVVDLAEMPPNWNVKSSRPRLAITFDDGWKDTYDIALPISRKYGVPISIFVCPGLAGISLPFWPERVTRAFRAAMHSPGVKKRLVEICVEEQLPINGSGAMLSRQCADAVISALKGLATKRRDEIVQKFELAAEACNIPIAAMDAAMTWEDTADAAERGAQIGSHTQTHQILTTLDSPQAQAELADSKRAIENQLKRNCLCFAYPNGSWSPEVRDSVIRAGYSHAFLNEVGIWTQHSDSWLIPRVNVWEGTFEGPSGRFSRVAFEYAAFWRCYRAEARKRKRMRRSPSTKR